MHVHVLCIILVASHCWVYCVEEDSVTVVKRRQVVGEDEVGEERNVKWGKTCYKAKIAACGKCLHTH